MSADVLTIQVRTFPDNGTRYPSANELIGKMRGHKTAEYHALRKAVAEAARAEMARVGWETATYFCDVYWKRYVINRRTFDASNSGIAELNGLEDAGVVENDRLVRWHPDVPQYDPRAGAVDRIAMVIMRTYPPAILADKPAPKHRPELISASSPEARRRTANKPRTLDDFRSGDKPTFTERDALLKELGIR
jgi:hypothetical protein